MIEGKWKLIGGETNGLDEPAEDIARSSLVIEENRHTVTVGDAVMTGTHELDPSQVPMRIDSTDTAGPFQNMSLKGIFKLEKDVLTLCFGGSGCRAASGVYDQERPGDDYAYLATSGLIFHVLCTSCSHQLFVPGGFRMRPNTVKQRVHDGGVSIGTFMFEFNTNGIGRLAAEAGAEFAVFDMEHTGWSVESIARLIATTRSTEMIPYVRIPATEYHFVARVLDVGAMGIMVPMVESVEQAEAITAAAKYPPVGRRGAAFGVAHDDFSGGDIVEKIGSANQQTHLIAQIETAAGVRNADAIAAIEGIDVLWIGHFDLTNSLGIPGQFDHPEFKAALATVLAACQKHHKVPGFMASGIDDGKSLLDQGFRMLAYGGDLWLYQEAVRAGVTALNRHAAE